MTLFDLGGAGLHYGSRAVLKGIKLQFASGELVAIAGPNGAGKSTLLNVMSGLRPHHQGACRYHGKEVNQWKRREFARKVATVPQSLSIDFPFSVEQVVGMGRAPFGNAMFESDDDRAAIEQAMDATSTRVFRDREFRSLSGGERQRVVLAAALAQDPESLLLDEPTTYLDLEHQIGLYKLLRGLCAKGLLVVAVTHDLNLAAAYASRIVMLRGGEVVADGAPSAVVTPAYLRDVFSVEATVIPSPSGSPWIHYGG